MKSFHMLYLAVILQLGGGLISPAYASTTGSVCVYDTTCVHCIDGFCVSCDLNTGSCAPVSQK